MYYKDYNGNRGKHLSKRDWRAYWWPDKKQNKNIRGQHLSHEEPRSIGPIEDKWDATRHSRLR